MSESTADTDHGRTEAGAGLVAGYVRVSVLHYPAACEDEASRRAHREALGVRRRAELVADAARDGQAITAWYEDLGVSGRRADRARRAGFDRLCRDAREGGLRRLYARDLSRLFRDATAQELWFAEMEAHAVEVRAADLPEAGDPAARRLARQQLGAIHEFLSARTGALLRAITREKVLGGEWVGSSGSHWGLRYDPATKGFAFDPETADRARLVFETFNACAGLASRAARRLNALLDAGDPRATPPPRGGRWGRGDLRLVRLAHYRRCVRFEGRLLPAAHLIPEVVAPAVVAATDRLLARSVSEKAFVRARVANGPPAGPEAGADAAQTTYAGLLLCGGCGGTMHAQHPPRAAPHLPCRDPGAPARTVQWLCGSRGRGPSAPGPRCRSLAGTTAARLDALTGRGVREALRLCGAGRGLAPPAPGLAAAQAPAARAEQLAFLEAARPPGARAARRDELRAWGLLGEADSGGEAPAPAPTLVPAGAWDPRFTRPLGAGPPLTDGEWRRFSNAAASLWPDAGWDDRAGQDALWAHPALQAGKRRLLCDLGVAPIVWILPRRADQRPVSRALQQLGGRVCLLLDCPRLGRGGPRSYYLLEPEPQWLAYRRWVYADTHPHGSP